MKNLQHLLFLDIETVSEKKSFDELAESRQALWLRKAEFLRNDDELNKENLYFDKAAIYSEFGKIVCISIGILYSDENQNLNIRIKAIYSHNEQALLEQFVQLIREKMDESKIQLCGHNSKEFDLPYLCRRMIINRVPLPPYLHLSGKKPWEISHIDTMEMWKFGDWKSFTSLALLTDVFDIPSPKDDISGKDVNRVYYQEDGLDRIAHYCNRDVLATAQVYLRISGRDLIENNNIHYVEEQKLSTLDDADAVELS
jgi:predicted PolB exonuclease-like 3'-5' exonuclease